MILGVVDKFGPLTPYAVRKHFAESPASPFSDSAGSIYPALERLEGEGLVRSRAGTRGRQPRREYAITPAGRRAVQAWLVDGLGDEDLEPPPDPIRTRLFFLGALSPAQRRRFLDRAIEGLERQVEVLRAYARRYARDDGQALSRHASEGMTAVTRARLRWLRSVRASLGD